MTRETTAWLLVLISGLLETARAVGMKRSEGFTRPAATAFTLATMAVGFYLLAVATRPLPISTGYPVWVGIGAIGTAIAGMAFLGEPTSPLRLASIGCIVLGVVGLKLAR